MDASNLNEHLLAVAEKLKAKGWQSAFVDVSVSYLAIFDRPAGPLDPMISYSPSIRATPHRADGSFHGNGGSQYYGPDAGTIRSLDEAVTKLHEIANKMPTMAEEADRIDAAMGKLTDAERRLLGVR